MLIINLVFVYLFCLKNDRDIRRLVVLQTAHRRTLRTIIPDHIADSLQKLFNSNINNTIKKQGETRNEPSGTINNRLFPVSILNIVMYLYAY